MCRIWRSAEQHSSWSPWEPGRKAADRMVAVWPWRWVGGRGWWVGGAVGWRLARARCSACCRVPPSCAASTTELRTIRRHPCAAHPSTRTVSSECRRSQPAAPAPPPRHRRSRQSSPPLASRSPPSVQASASTAPECPGSAAVRPRRRASPASPSTAPAKRAGRWPQAAAPGNDSQAHSRSASTRSICELVCTPRAGRRSAWGSEALWREGDCSGGGTRHRGVPPVLHDQPGGRWRVAKRTFVPNSVSTKCCMGRPMRRLWRLGSNSVVFLRPIIRVPSDWGTSSGAWSAQNCETPRLASHSPSAALAARRTAPPNVISRKPSCGAQEGSASPCGGDFLRCLLTGPETALRALCKRWKLTKCAPCCPAAAAALPAPAPPPRTPLERPNFATYCRPDPACTSPARTSGHRRARAGAPPCIGSRPCSRERQLAAQPGPAGAAVQAAG